jgi:hypothetical protein
MYNLYGGSSSLPSMPSLDILSGGTSGGVVFPDALRETKPGDPVVMNSPGDFYSRVGGRVRFRNRYRQFNLERKTIPSK